jgi:hypothetical protein
MTIEHLSFSSLNTYNGCPRRYYLGRVKHAEALPAWYFAIGTAVHSYIELHLGGSEVSVESLFISEVEKLQLIEADTSKWLYSGNQEAPLIEEVALKHAEACVETALTILQDVEVWEVEPDITGYLPGCSLPIKGFPDVLGEHRKHGPVILDWKTGAKPKNALQLETYNALLEVSRRHAAVVNRGEWVGLWAMLKPGLYKDPVRKVELKETPESMGAKFHEVEERIAKKIFPAMPEFACKFCEQKPNCKLQSGLTARTKYFDTVEKDGGYPF